MFLQAQMSFQVGHCVKCDQLGSVSKSVSVKCHDIHASNLEYCAVVRAQTLKRAWETFPVMSRFIKTEHLFYRLLQLQHSEARQRQNQKGNTFWRSTDPSDG